MTVANLSKWLFVSSGAYALLCIPAILLAERFSWHESFFHATQFLAIACCFPASLAVLWFTRGTRSWLRKLAIAALILCGAWIAFLAYVLFGMDVATD
jgi:hypothetical protein